MSAIKYMFDKSDTGKNYKVEIDSNNQYGCFEHLRVGDASGGCLWFSNNELTDYDGVSVLPKSVIESIRKLGFVVPEEFE